MRYEDESGRSREEARQEKCVRSRPGEYQAETGKREEWREREESERRAIVREGVRGEGE